MNELNLNITSKKYKQKIGFILGLILFLSICISQPISTGMENILPTQIYESEILKGEVVKSFNYVLALMGLMVIWWVTEAIPLQATALLPAIILPLLQVKGFTSNEIYNFNFINSLRNYANPVIGMFLGSFLIASAFQKHSLDKRVTVWILSRLKIYSNSKITILVLMYTTAFLSMWISNTATVAIMLPIALGILNSIKNKDLNFDSAMLLGIAWSASVGGIATIVGTPPNGIAVSLLEAQNIVDLNFLDWMKIGLPFMLLFIPIIWGILVKIFKLEKKTNIEFDYLQTVKLSLGKIKRSEILLTILFLIIVFSWITNPFWDDILPEVVSKNLEWIDEFMIGLVGGIILFIVPISFKSFEFILNWKDTKNVDWGTLILFGGGLTLSDAMFKTGLATWLANSFLNVFGSPSTLFLLLFTVLFIVLLTEITSNTAVIAMMAPVIIAISSATGKETATLVIGAAIAASMAFMLPVATPPNAIVYGTGKIKLFDMIRIGFILEIIGWLFTIFILFFFGNLIFNIINF